MILPVYWASCRATIISALLTSLLLALPHSFLSSVNGHSPLPLLFSHTFKPITASLLSVLQLCSLLEHATVVIYFGLFFAGHLCLDSLLEVGGWRLLTKNNSINNL